MRLPTYAFGKEFTHIPEHVRQDLDTLKRECAVYADFWIEVVGDFRHVRIDFTAEERHEYLRRSWAYELFIRLLIRLESIRTSQLMRIRTQATCETAL